MDQTCSQVGLRWRDEIVSLLQRLLNAAPVLRYLHGSHPIEAVAEGGPGNSLASGFLRRLSVQLHFRRAVRYWVRCWLVGQAWL